MNPLNNVYVRVLTYVASTLIGMIPAFAIGWFAWDYTDGWIRISLQVEGAITAGVTALGISGGVFKIWGTK